METAYTWMRGRVVGVKVKVLGVTLVGASIVSAAVDAAAVAVVAVPMPVPASVPVPVPVTEAVTGVVSLGRRARPMKTSRKSVAFCGRFMMTSSKWVPRWSKVRMKSLWGGVGWVEVRWGGSAQRTTGVAGEKQGVREVEGGKGVVCGDLGDEGG